MYTVVHASISIYNPFSVIITLIIVFTATNIRHSILGYRYKHNVNVNAKSGIVKNTFLCITV